MITLKNVTLRRSAKVLLNGVNATINPGEKVGLVGRNGAGKSSLFALFNGSLHEDGGDFYIPAQWRMAQVAQNMPETDESATDFVVTGDTRLVELRAQLVQAEAEDDGMAIAHAYTDLADAGDHDAIPRAQALILGLGFKVSELDKPVNSFSGGWRMRLQLARALMCPSDLLLLDEPTNHLDLDALVWLEAWLKRYEGTMIVISHDREFLDAVTNVTMHIDNAQITRYGGNYSKFEDLRAQQLELQQASFAKQQEKIAHLKKFIDRFKAKASKAKQAQSRLKRLEKLSGTEAVRAERPFSFQFPVPGRLPDSMLQLEDIVAGYPADPAAGSGEAAHIVLSDVRFSIEAGERIGLLGPNGAGKSTLVKTLVGELEPFGGERKSHKDLKIGYFAQHTVESLREGASPLDHLLDKAPGVATQVMRDFLGTWNFAGDRAFESVDGFSGGERARLALALIAWDKPNLLLLDEPTNHLDLDMREALADALADFDGALVLVSHDRHLLGMVCDSFWRVADGEVAPFDGDLDDYARWLKTRTAASKKVAKPAVARVDVSPEERRRQAVAQRENEKTARQRVKKIETRTATIDTELVALETQLADPATYNGPTSEMMRLGQRQTELRREKEALETEWLALVELLEA